MAAPLTWRNVDAPDFRGSMVGLGIAGQSINNAFNGINAGLDKFQDWRKDQAESAVLNNSMGFTDPQQLREAIARGEVFNGVDRSLLGRQALGALDGRAGVLLNQAAAQQDLNTKQQLDPLNIQNAKRELAFNTANDPTRLAQGRATLDSTIAGTESTRAGTASTIQQTGQRGTEFGWRTSDRADDEAAKPVLARFQDGTMNDSDARAFFQTPQFAGLSAGAQAKIRAYAGATYPGLFGPPGSGAAGGGAPAAGGAPGTRSGSIADVTYGFTPTPQPISSMPIGAVIDYQKTQLLPSQGASPVGAFQINHGTLADYAPKVLGADWKNQPLTLENQDKIARAIFEDRKSGNLSQTWASLPDKGAGGYANVPWEQIRGQIAQRETGGDLGAADRLRSEVTGVNARANQATGQVAARVSQDVAGTVVPKYAETMADTKSTIGDATAKLRAGVFKDLPEGRIINELNKIIQMGGGKINAATAAAILENNVQGADWFDRNRPTWLGGHGAIPQQEGVERDVGLVIRGRTFDALQSAQSTGAVAGSIEAARAAYEQTAAQVAEATRRGMTERLPAYRAQLELRKAALEGLLARHSVDDTLQPRFDRPAPPPAEAPVARVVGDATPARRFPNRDGR